MTKAEVNAMRDYTKLGTKVEIEEDMIECTKRPARIGVIIKKYPEVFLAKLKDGKTMCFQWKELLMPTGAVKLRG